MIELDTRNPRVRTLFAKAASERQAKLKELLRKANVDRLEIRTDQAYATRMQRLFRMREQKR
jgi:hypothetical protein